MNDRVKEAVGVTILAVVAVGLFVMVLWAARLL